MKNNSQSRVLDHQHTMPGKTMPGKTLLKKIVAIDAATCLYQFVVAIRTGSA